MEKHNSCKGCDNTSLQNVSLHSHADDYNSVRSRKSYAEVIEMNESSTSSIQLHSLNNYECCGSVYRDESSALEYIVSAHLRKCTNKGFQYQCNACDLKSEYRHYFIGHLSEHFGIKLFACQNCSRRFRWKSGLTTHGKSCAHAFKCSNCDFKTHREEDFLTPLKICMENVSMISEINPTSDNKRKRKEARCNSIKGKESNIYAKRVNSKYSNTSLGNNQTIDIENKLEDETNKKVSMLESESKLCEGLERRADIQKELQIDSSLSTNSYTRYVSYVTKDSPEAKYKTEDVPQIPVNERYINKFPSPSFLFNAYQFPQTQPKASLLKPKATSVYPDTYPGEDMIMSVKELDNINSPLDVLPKLASLIQSYIKRD